MTEVQSTILNLLSNALFDRKRVIQRQDWIDVLQETKNQAIGQLVESVLDRSLLSTEEAKAWKEFALTGIAHNIRVNHNHSQLHEWLSDIPYVILKGTASAFYYPVPSYRSMGDVDFLVREEDLNRVGEILAKHGLKPWDEEHISHIVFRGLGMHYEMHFNLAGTPNGTAGDLVREYTNDIFEKAQELTIDTGKAMLPSPFHHGLVLLLHTCHHLTGEGIGLRHLCDWAVFENSFSDEEFQEMFEYKLKKIGLWHFAQVLTRASVKYLGADDKTWAVADERLVDAIMEDILTGGNFGRKDSNRAIQTMLISDRGKDGVGKSSIPVQFLRSANKIVYVKWPAARKNKLLLPVGWIVFGARRVIRELVGKRKKTNIKRLFDCADQRRKLYSQLRLYETED